MYFHVKGGRKTTWLDSADQRAMITVGVRRKRKTKKNQEDQKSGVSGGGDGDGEHVERRRRSRSEKEEEEEKSRIEADSTHETRWALPCDARAALDSSYMMFAHSVAPSEMFA
jgi:hypothetical protein